MTDFFELLTHNLAVQAFGLSLLHSLWQGVLIASVLWLVNQWVTSQFAQWRYGLACLSLLSLIFIFSYTFYQEYQYLQALQKLEVQSVPFTLDQSGEQVLQSGQDSGFFTELTLGYQQAMQWISSYSIYIFLFWLTGFILFAIRLSMGLLFTERLVHQGKPLPHIWMRKLESLQEKIGYHKKIRLLSADAATTPFTFGWLKPVIMFPVSLLTQLPADQVESILLHELAHIKRRDYLINLLQALAEIAFFFNPSFWYISTVLEKERENACDDLVLAATHDRVSYARALTNLARLCQLETISPAALAIAQKKQSLMRRIQRIVYYSQTNPMMKKSFKTRWYQLAMISMVCMLLAFVTVEVKGNKGISEIKTAEIMDHEKEQLPDTVIRQGKIKTRHINGDKEPLYMLDGKPVESISSLNSNDIISVDVLKDEKAFALYGEKGKNGVVLITTKSGKRSTNIANDLIEVRDTSVFDSELEKISDGQKTDTVYYQEGNKKVTFYEVRPSEISSGNKELIKRDIEYGKKDHHSFEISVPSNGVGVLDEKGNLKIKGDTIYLKFQDGSQNGPEPKMYFLDEKEIKKEVMEKIPPESIASVSVFKGQTAIDKFGEKAGDGVIEIFTKKYAEKTPKAEPEPLFVLDGKIIAREAVRKEVNEDEIPQMEMLKGQKAIDKYGEKGKNGVVLNKITSKGKQPPTKPTKKDGFSESLSVFPNPSAHEFTIQFTIAEKVPVKIMVLDKNGILVAELLDKTLKKGVHEINWEAASQKPGVYTVAITQGDEVYSRHIIVK